MNQRNADFHILLLQEYGLTALIHPALLVLPQTVNSLAGIRQETLANPQCRTPGIINRNETNGRSLFLQQRPAFLIRKTDLT